MAVVNLLSVAITNRDATPKVLEDAWLSKGGVYESSGYVQTGSADNIASTYRLVSVPSNARVGSLQFQTSSLGTSCTLDIGVWYPTFIPAGAGLDTSKASKVINTTIFASALAASSAVEAKDLVSNAQIAINLQEQPLWQLAGLATDPGIDLDIVCYVHAVVQLQGYVGLKARYSY